MIILTIFVVLIFAAVWHLIYENIVAPSLRMGIRNQLFQLRDELRKHYRAKDLSESDREILDFVEGSINRFLNQLAYLSLFDLFGVKRKIETNRILHDRVEKRLEMVKACSNPEVVKIWNKAIHVSIISIGINHGAAAIYILPWISVLIFIQSVTKMIGEIFVLPQYNADELFPEISREVSV